VRGWIAEFLEGASQEESGEGVSAEGELDGRPSGLTPMVESTNSLRTAAG
jgi:hypothetical protein